MTDVFITPEAFIDGHRGLLKLKKEFQIFWIFSKYPIYHPP